MAARARTFLLAVLLALAATQTGCGPSGPRLIPVFPVEGSLFVKGKPASGAAVTFHPLPLKAGMPTGVRPRGTVGDDGTFRLTTYKADDGAPEGDFAVTVYWPGKRTGEAAEGEEFEGLPPDQLGFRYQDPAKSTLKATVKAPRTNLDRFELP